MKLRSDFVSNSSSSSFVLNSNQSGLREFFQEFKKLFAKLHWISCSFESEAKAKSALAKFESFPEVQEWCKENKLPCEITEQFEVMLHPSMLTANEQLFEICWALIESSDRIEIRIADSWGDYNFALHQILTLLEYKGFDFHEGYSEEGWVKMNLKDNDNENQK